MISEKEAINAILAPRLGEAKGSGELVDLVPAVRKALKELNEVSKDHRPTCRQHAEEPPRPAALAGHGRRNSTRARLRWRSTRRLPGDTCRRQELRLPRRCGGDGASHR